MDSLFHRLRSLFSAFFRIAAFTLCGGMVMLPLMEEEFVRKDAGSVRRILRVL